MGRKPRHMSTTAIIGITTAAIIGIILALLLVAGGAKASSPWQWPPPGGEQAPSVVLGRPDGLWETFPARCQVWEDGSARCGEWNQPRPGYRDEQLQTW